MKAVYIGILTPGTTSRMRAEWLRRLRPEWTWQWIDTDGPMRSCHRLWQSLAFRAKVGPAVEAVQRAVMGHFAGATWDWVWVDKGVFLGPEQVLGLRERAGRMVHFTPDTAFHANRSRLFYASMGSYDTLVTTKSFEVAEYERRVGAEKVILTTQGYDAAIHYPRVAGAGRRREVVFVGLAEPDRERCLGLFLEQGIPVRLAGWGWGRFLARWGSAPHLHFAGEGLFGDGYAELLSGSWVGLGLLSKRFPELHTTRTFEIPACGAILATERTCDTERFFGDGEAIFGANYGELAVKVKALLESEGEGELGAWAEAGRRRVLAEGRDYGSLLGTLLQQAESRTN